MPNLIRLRDPLTRYTAQKGKGYPTDNTGLGPAQPPWPRPPLPVSFGPDPGYSLTLPVSRLVFLCAVGMYV